MADNTIPNNNDQSELDKSFKEQERLLPIANVGRIMKQILPPNAKISKEAKETMEEYVSEFIGFVTSEASEKCKKERRKIVNGDDVCWALRTLGFEDYANPMNVYLLRYREMEGERTDQDHNRVNNTDDTDIQEPSSSTRDPNSAQQSVARGGY